MRADPDLLNKILRPIPQPLNQPLCSMFLSRVLFIYWWTSYKWYKLIQKNLKNH